MKLDKELDFYKLFWNKNANTVAFKLNIILNIFIDITSLKKFFSWLIYTLSFSTFKVKQLFQLQNHKIMREKYIIKLVSGENDMKVMAKNNQCLYWYFM